jgi:hypothetical protein
LSRAFRIYLGTPVKKALKQTQVAGFPAGLPPCLQHWQAACTPQTLLIG